MAFGRVRTGIRLRTDRHLSVPRSGRFLNMVRPGRVGPTSVKYPRNPGQIQESLKTDRVFITSNMDVTGRVLTTLQLSIGMGIISIGPCAKGSICISIASSLVEITLRPIHYLS